MRADSNIYIWSEIADDWVPMGKLQGPQGPQGPQGKQGIQGVKGANGQSAFTSACQGGYTNSSKVDDIARNVNLGNWTYLNSTKPNAYPTGVSNGYQYIRLDTPWKNARNCARIESGGYIGTGDTATINFSHTPQILFITRMESHSFNAVIALYGQTIVKLNDITYDIKWNNDNVRVSGLDFTGEAYFYTFVY